jgi:hypothetical protein
MSNCQKLFFSGSLLSANSSTVTYDPATGILSVNGQSLTPLTGLKQADGTVIAVGAGGVVTLPNFVKSIKDSLGNTLTVGADGTVTLPGAAATAFAPIAGNAATNVQQAIANLQAGSVAKGTPFANSAATVTNAAGQVVTLPNPSVFSIMVFDPITGAPSWKAPTSSFGNPVVF